MKKRTPKYCRRLAKNTFISFDFNLIIKLMSVYEQK